MAPKMGRLEDWLTSPSRRPGQFARPLVTLSYAQSLDGSIAQRRGQPLALSGPESLALSHRLRAMHDAILVGIGTILADNPQLNVRLAEGEDPVVIILDSRLRFPLNAAAAREPERLRLFCTALADAQAQQGLEQAGVQVERQAANQSERVDLKTMLARLHEWGITSLMVEGGGQVMGSFLKENLVDRVAITISPMYVGGYKALDGNIEFGGRLPRLRDLEFEKHGEDLVLWGDLA